MKAQLTSALITVFHIGLLILTLAAFDDITTSNEASTTEEWLTILIIFIYFIYRSYQAHFSKLKSN